MKLSENHFWLSLTHFEDLIVVSLSNIIKIPVSILLNLSFFQPFSLFCLTTRFRITLECFISSHYNSFKRSLLQQIHLLLSILDHLLLPSLDFPLRILCLQTSTCSHLSFQFQKCTVIFCTIGRVCPWTCSLMKLRYLQVQAVKWRVWQTSLLRSCLQCMF